MDSVTWVRMVKKTDLMLWPRRRFSDSYMCSSCRDVNCYLLLCSWCSCQNVQNQFKNCFLCKLLLMSDWNNFFVSIPNLYCLLIITLGTINVNKCPGILAIEIVSNCNIWGDITNWGNFLVDEFILRKWMSAFERSLSIHSL